MLATQVKFGERKLQVNVILEIGEREALPVRARNLVVDSQISNFQIYMGRARKGSIRCQVANISRCVESEHIINYLFSTKSM